jgi:hypothetical protein
MSGTAAPLITDNIADISIQASKPVTVSVTTNSPTTQTVTFIRGGQTIYCFSGAGERNLIGSAQMNDSSRFQAKFEFQPKGGALSKSALRTGGPYSIGSTNFLIVVAENGDDADYNDVVVQFSWKS